MRNVECEIEIDAAPEKVLDAFLQQDRLSGWWSVERSFIEAKTGGSYILLWGVSDSGVKYMNTGIIESIHPSDHLHISNWMYVNPEKQILGPQHLKIDVAPSAGGSLLKLTQGDYPENAGKDWEWYYEVVRDAWPFVLKELKAYLENH
jgi:uncharacterized protein YndB with AHSA1/START domain